MTKNSGRRILTEGAHTNVERLVTFTQVGWLIHRPGNDAFVPMSGDLAAALKSVPHGGYSPVWVEGPNE